jgi:hypothetical protein
MSHERQGTGFDSGDAGHEWQGRVSSPPLAPVDTEAHMDDYVARERHDLVGTPRIILGLSGLAGSGKSTAAMHLVKNRGWARVRFAGPLKDMCRALGLSEDEIEGSLKEVACRKLTHENFGTLLSNVDAAFGAIGAWRANQRDRIPVLCSRTFEFAYSAFVGVLARVVALGEPNGGTTPRRLMQMIGTEWGRDLIGPDVWIRLWRAALDRLPAGQHVAVDDCRFPNESDAIRAAGGFMVRITRPDAGQGAAGHSSEGQDLGLMVDTLDNSGAVDLLAYRINSLVRDLSWIAASMLVTTGGHSRPPSPSP